MDAGGSLKCIWTLSARALLRGSRREGGPSSWTTKARDLGFSGLGFRI